MDKKSEIESKLLSITANYKLEFSSKFKKSNSFFDTMKSKYSLLALLSPRLTDELVNEANRYFQDNNIQDKDQLNKFIEACCHDFARLGLES